MHIQCKYLSTDIKKHHSPFAKRNILEPGCRSGKGGENKQSLETSKEEANATEGASATQHKAQGDHGAVKYKKEEGAEEERSENTEVLNITPTIKQGFSWGPHTSAT